MSTAGFDHLSAQRPRLDLARTAASRKRSGRKHGVLDSVTLTSVTASEAHLQAYRDLISENLMRLHGQLVNLHDRLEHMQQLAAKAGAKLPATDEQTH